MSVHCSENVRCVLVSMQMYRADCALQIGCPMWPHEASPLIARISSRSQVMFGGMQDTFPDKRDPDATIYRVLLHIPWT